MKITKNGVRSEKLWPKQNLQRGRPGGRPRPAGRPAGSTFLDVKMGNFGRKNSPINTKSEGKSKEFGHENAKGGRSTSIAMDPRIKTYQNSLKSHIDPKAISGYFFVEFSKLAKSKKNFVDLAVETKANPW